MNNKKSDRGPLMFILITIVLIISSIATHIFH